MLRRGDAAQIFGLIFLLSRDQLPAPMAIWVITPSTVQEHVIWISRLFKDFPINERFRFQFRTEFFNLFNTPQFNGDAGLDKTEGNSSFGRISSTLAGTERHIQFALRLQF